VAMVLAAMLLLSVSHFRSHFPRPLFRQIKSPTITYCFFLFFSSVFQGSRGPLPLTPEKPLKHVAKVMAAPVSGVTEGDLVAAAADEYDRPLDYYGDQDPPRVVSRDTPDEAAGGDVINHPAQKETDDVIVKLTGVKNTLTGEQTFSLCSKKGKKKRRESNSVVT